MPMSNTRPRTFEEVVAAQDPAETARLERGDRFVDPSVNAFHGEVSVNEDRYGTGEWRVEDFDDDGGCYVTIFACDHGLVGERCNHLNVSVVEWLHRASAQQNDTNRFSFT